MIIVNLTGFVRLFKSSYPVKTHCFCLFLSLQQMSTRFRILLERSVYGDDECGHAVSIR